MTPLSTRAADTGTDEIGPAIIQAAIARGTLPVAPMAMPLQQIEAQRGAILPRVFASLTLRTGN